MLLLKITNIEHFKEVLVFWYNHIREHDDGSNEFLADFIWDKVIPNIETGDENIKKLKELCHRIDKFMDDYSGTDEENEVIDKFEHEAEEFLDTYKDKFPVYITINCFGDATTTVYQFQIWSEKDIQFKNINQIKEYIV